MIEVFRPGQKFTPRNKRKCDSEAEVERYFRLQVKHNGGVSRKLPARYIKGIHDQLVWFPGSEIWTVEIKAPDGKKSPHQKEFHERLFEIGNTRSVTLWCKEDVDLFFRLRVRIRNNDMSCEDRRHLLELRLGRIKR